MDILSLGITYAICSLLFVIICAIAHAHDANKFVKGLCYIGMVFPPLAIFIFAMWLLGALVANIIVLIELVCKSFVKFANKVFVTRISDLYTKHVLLPHRARVKHKNHLKRKALWEASRKA